MFVKTIVIILCFLSIASAHEAPEQIDFQADKLIFDETTKTVKGDGNVFVKYGKRFLHADEIIYNKTDDKLYARGNVWLLEPNGEVIFANEIDLRNKFSVGVVEEIKVLLIDQSRLAAKSAVRYHPKKVLFQNAVYSPCKVCKENSVFWQIKASCVLHDEETHSMEYKDMQIEVLDVPVAYLPYFRHPDLTVKRKSGVGRPSYGRSRDLGFIFRLPIYYDIDPSQDLTIEPIIMTNQWPVIHSIYRKKTPNGEFMIDGSYTYSRSLKLRRPPRKAVLQEEVEGRNPSHNRWHLFFNGRYEMSRKDLFTYDLRRTSDLTYLRRYPIRTWEPDSAQMKNLTSNIRYERFMQRAYGRLEGYAFQTDSKTTPLIFPSGYYEYNSTPSLYGGEVYIIANALSLSRNHPRLTRGAKNMTRATMILGWERSYVTSRGDVWTTNISNQVDGYAIHGLRPRSLTQKPQSYWRGRLSPQLSVQWKYPLIQDFRWCSWVLEPKIKLFASPRGGNSIAYPNEDSGLFVIEYTHAFINRFDGFDRLDNGVRAVFGVNNVLFLPHQRRIKLFLGKTIRVTRQRVLPHGAGEDKVGSDWLINLKSDVSDWCKVDYTASLQRKDLRPRLSQARAQFGPELINLNISHVYLSKIASVNHKRLSQLNWELRSHPVDCWYVSVSQSCDLTRTGGNYNLASLFAIKYENDCAQAAIGFYRSNYRDKDIRPDTGFLLKISLKNLGSLSPINAGSYPSQLLGKSWF